jgi:hypothetical protein
MFAFSVFSRHPLNVLGALTALLMGSTLAGQRAEALSPMNPGMSHAAAANERTIEVRGGHGGGGGGGGGGGRGATGGFSGGRGFSAGSFSGAVVRGGPIGAGVAGVATGPRFAGHHFFHHRHGFFVGGVYYDDYPYDYPDYYDDPTVYPEPAYSVPAYVAGGGCRRVLTVHGPRIICHHRAARHHRIHRRHHHRRHHHA